MKRGVGVSAVWRDLLNSIVVTGEMRRLLDINTDPSEHRVVQDLGSLRPFASRLVQKE